MTEKSSKRWLTPAKIVRTAPDRGDPAKSGRRQRGHAPRSGRAARVRTRRPEPTHVHAGQTDQGENLRQPYRNVRAALSVELLHQRLRILPVPPEKQNHSAPQAHPGGNPPRGNRPAGYGSQAFSAGGGRRSAQQSDRVHSRINQDHLLRTSQERSDSPREREYRGYDGRELPQAARCRHRHLHSLSGDLQQKPLTKRSTPPVRRATTPTTPKRWTARWKAASTT